MPESTFPGWFRLIRPQDFVWIPLFIALAATSEILDVFVVVPLVALGLVQVLEPKIPALRSTRGRVAWILLKLVLVYLLIAYTGGIESNFWLLLLLPVVSAATVSGLVGTLVFTALAAGAYLSFLLFLDWEKVVLEQPEIEILIQRLVCLFMVGNLANVLAEELRVQSEKHRRTAEHLAEANRQVLEAHEAVRRSDRLAALGQLTAGLAHELRNPLGTIKASAEMLNKHADRGERSGARNGGVHLDGSGPHQFAGHAISAVRAPAEAAPGDGGPGAPAGPGHRGRPSARRRGSRSTGTTRRRFRRFPSMRS